MPELREIVEDLAEEHAALESLVADLDDGGWDTLTPAEPWTIRDQISHLAFFDEQARVAIESPDAFAESLREIAQDVGAYMDRSISKGRAMTPVGVLEWWRSERSALLHTSSKLEPGARIAWYGPPMSPKSFFSARIMETWAHGQDIADALGIQRSPGNRLRHVAHLCVLSRPNSYAARGLEVPDGSVRVDVVGPHGDSWVWNQEADASVSGSAVDFCLVATQRRHPADTDLVVDGELAREWIDIAQAYAGPPGEGRSPGQFRSRDASDADR
jgi:uncharacterized protein (TIGR03084 family)